MSNRKSVSRRIVLGLSVVGVLAAVTTVACVREQGPEQVARAGGPGAGGAPKANIKQAPAAQAAKFWQMFGGDQTRNMVNTTERDMPQEWHVENKRKNIAAKNIKWVATLGSQSYGNPVIYRGKIYVGTNNGALKNARDGKKEDNELVPVDKGNLMCFEEATGKFLWQAVHDKLASGRVNDWPEQGVCSSPFAEGNRIYYVNNRCELVCADTEGFLDGKNDGVQDEKYKDKTDVDVIWRLDMMEELGVFPHNLAVCSPLVIGDLVFIVTGNGHDESHENIPSPKAPSFIAVNKLTGKVVWENALPGERILHGQWSNPCAVTVRGQTHIVFPGGDGWLYAFEPMEGKLLWKFDCNPKDSRWVLGGKGTRNNLIGTPTVWQNKIYIAVGQDPEHGEGVGHLWCVDPSKPDLKKGVDVSPTLVVDKDGKAVERKNWVVVEEGVNKGLMALDPTKGEKVVPNPNSAVSWHFGGIEKKGNETNLVWRRTISSSAVHDGLLYVANLSGFVACLDAKTGQKYWEHDTLAAIWGSPFYVDGKVYLATDEGKVYVFAHGKEKKLLAENDMDAPVLSTPVAINGTLYVMTRQHLFALGK